MASKSSRSGSALVATLLFMALMLGLLLYYTALVRMQSDTRSVERSIFLARLEARNAVENALAEMTESYVDPSGSPVKRVYSVDEQREEWRSVGEGKSAGEWVSETLADALGWPERLRGTGEDSLRERAASAEWVVEGDVNEVHTAHAWAGVDLTGLIDPNHVENLSPEGLGFSGSLERVFVTAAEVAEAFPGAEPVFVPGGFSRDDGWYDFDAREWRTEVEVGGETVGEIPGRWSMDQVRAVMAELFPERDADALAVAFDDYREGREIPTDPEGLTAVAVPMINEVAATLIVRNDGGLVTVSNRVDIEVWYPYPFNAQTREYRMPRTPELVAKTPESAPAAFEARDSDEEWEFTASGAFARLSLETQSVPLPLPEGRELALEWDLEGLLLERLDGSGVVDRLPAGIALSLPAVSVPAEGEVAEVSAGIEVVDPRLNHEPEHWIPADEDSLEAVNLAALDAREGDELVDPFICWAPAGAVSETMDPAEWIGYFPIGEPWKSFDLFGDEGRWWARHTRAGDARSISGWSRDRINPNSTAPNALGAAFAGLELRERPEASGTPLTSAEGEALGLEVGAAFEGGDGFTQRGDWMWALENQLLDPEGIAAGRHAAEAVAAQSLRRLSTRSRVWGVVAVAETRAPGGRALAHETLAVILWSDPFPEPDGMHRFHRLQTLSLQKE